jgi:DNA processing protein
MVLPLDGDRPDAPAPTPAARGRAPRDFETPDERRAFDAIPRRGAAVREIAVAAGLSAPEARAALGALELSAQVVRDGNVWRRAPQRR